MPTSYLNGIEQQSRKVAGRVLQRVDNEPVIGANIVVTGTTISTITDVEDVSHWTTCQANARTLTVSFGGMTSQTLQDQIRDDDNFWRLIRKHWMR